MLRKAIATVALSDPLPEKLGAAAAIGFDGVEVIEADLLADEATSRASLPTSASPSSSTHRSSTFRRCPTHAEAAADAPLRNMDVLS